MKRDHRNLKDATLAFPMYDFHIFISNRFFENQPNEICSHLSEKASQKAGFLSSRSSKITVTKEKERRKRKSGRRRKGGEEKKAMVRLHC